MPRYMTTLARAQRQQMTPAGRLLWESLRNRRLAGFRFKREHVLGRYIADFYCAKARLVIEVDGAVHDSEEAKVYDKVRDETMAAYGLRVMRFKNEDVLNDLDGVLFEIRKALTPDPSPDFGRGEFKC